MENTIQIDLKSIDNRYINEEIIETYEKAYSTILFSSNHVFKLFRQRDELYNEKAAKEEYEWDYAMPFLKPVFHKFIDSLGNKHCLLVMNRLPVQSNILFGLVNQTLTTDTIIEVGKNVFALQNKYKVHNKSALEIYENYISNINMQMSYLDKKLPFSIKKQISDIVSSSICREVFLKHERDSSCSIVHGNMFTGNIFFYCNDLVIIDPISASHPSRYSYSDIDIATYLTDLRLLLPEDDYNLCFCQITNLLPLNRIALINFFILLKILVRIRFAYVELQLPNLIHETNMNYWVTKVGVDVLAHHISNLYCVLEKN